MTRTWREEEIAAYVDGSVNEEEAMRIEELLANDPEARAYADEIWHSNKLLRAAYADIAEAPVPKSLAEIVRSESSNVVPLAWLSRVPKVWLPAAAAAAASVAVVIGLAAGLSLQTPSAPRQVTLGDAPLESDLATALETVPSGTMYADRIVPMLTFQDAAGRYCREFEVSGALPDELEFGIACRMPDEVWHVEIIVTAPVAEHGESGFVPASGPGGDALDAVLDSLGAGLPLSQDEERQLIDRQWRED